MNNILEEIEEFKEKIANFRMESEVGTKKMKQQFHKDAIIAKNKMIENEKSRVEEIKDNIYKILAKRYDNMIPNNTVKENFDDKLKILKNDIILNNNLFSVYNRSGLLKVESQFDFYEDKDLDIINDLISNIITIYDKMGIKLKIEDFKYTMYTYDYMECFFKNYQNNNKKIIKDKFEEIYWESPSLITQIKFNFKIIFKKYYKLINMYLSKTSTSYIEVINKYNRVFEHKDESDFNTRSIVEKFISKELNIDYFISSSPERKKLFDDFLEKKSFDELNDIEKSNYFKDIINLKNTLNEVKNFNKFKELISILVDKYNKKSDYKNLLINKKKEIEKEENNKNKIIKKYYKNLKPSLISKFNSSKDVKLKLELNNKINDLKELYTSLDEIYLNDLFIKLDDSATLYDLLFIAYNDYKFSNNILSENITMDDLFDFLYNPYNSFINKISVLNYENVYSIVQKKCDLLNIKIEMEDITNPDNILNELNKILIIYYINNSNFTFDQIKELCLINEIKDS